MLKLAVNEVTTYRWTLDEDAAHYVQAGFSGIGVWRRKLADFGEERGRELLADSGLTVSSLGWCGGFTGADGRTLKESIADARAAIEAAADIKAANLVLYSGGRGGHTHNHARRLLVSALKDLAPLAEEHGLRLALEPMHPACGTDWTFLNTIEETLNIIGQVASPALGVAVDIYHLGYAEDFLDSIRANLHAIALVQVADAREEPGDEQDRCPVGEGVLPVADLMSLLAEAEYDGWVEVELIGPDIESRDYLQLLQQSHQSVTALV